MYATIHALFNKDLSLKDKHPRCVFQARALYLQEKLGIKASDFPKVSCPGFLDFQTKVNPQSASVIFSSYYVNSPASAFGHTLLRLNREPRLKDGKRHELLDMGISYAANATTDNPFLYTLFGLFGGFKGVFSAIPYYYKIREYNDFESRDLWTYDLNLSKPQVQMLMAHLWELGHTHFDYFFLSENCSYHLLTLLEILNPKWSFSDDLPFYVIPVETLKVLKRQEGLVGKRHFRPSLRSKFGHFVEQLSGDEKDELDEILETRDPAGLDKDLTKKQKARVLDVAMEYVDYKHAADILIKGGEIKEWKEKLLIARSQLPVSSDLESPKPDFGKSPDHGHGPHRLGLMGGSIDGDQTYEELSFRFALHDFLDAKVGQPEFASIQFMNSKFRYNNDTHRFYFEDLALVEVMSLNPLTKYDNTVSIRAKFGAETIRDTNCNGCFAPNLEGGAGITFKYKGAIHWTNIILAEIDIAFHKRLHRAWTKIAMGPAVYSIIDWTDKVSTQIHGKLYQIPTSQNISYLEYGVENRFSWSNRYAFGLKYLNRENLYEASAGFFYYY